MKKANRKSAAAMAAVVVAMMAMAAAADAAVQRAPAGDEAAPRSLGAMSRARVAVDAGWMILRAKLAGANGMIRIGSGDENGLGGRSAPLQRVRVGA